MTEDVPKRTRWAGKGSGAGEGKGHSRPGRATQGTPVCTRPGPPARAPPGYGGPAPALGVPGSGLGYSLLCSRPREAYFDGWRSRLSGGQWARAPGFPRPSNPGAPPLRLPTWSGPAPLACSPGAVPRAASSAIAGPRCRACLRASGRSLSPASRLLLGPRELKRSWGAGGAALLTSKAEPVVASGREMVVVSVPAEVTVILLDIEGTTTPIAFVKVRGGRERGSYLCLKAPERNFKCCRFCRRDSGEVAWLSVSGMGKRGCGGLRGCFFSRHHLLPRPCLRLDGG